MRLSSFVIDPLHVPPPYLVKQKRKGNNSPLWLFRLVAKKKKEMSQLSSSLCVRSWASEVIRDCDKITLQIFTEQLSIPSLLLYYFLAILPRLVLEERRKKIVTRSLLVWFNVCHAAPTGHFQLDRALPAALLSRYRCSDGRADGRAGERKEIRGGKREMV
jgi:hypothetical protein